MNNETIRGYQDNSALPIKKGQEVTVPKGTLYNYRGKLVEAKRAYKVKVDHLLSGRARAAQ